jgi:hypothetical protein
MILFLALTITSVRFVSQPDHNPRELRTALDASEDTTLTVTSSLQRLEEVLSHPPLRQLDVSLLPIDREKLESELTSEWHSKAIVEEKLRDAPALVRQEWGSMWSGEIPWFSALVTFADGKWVRLRSASRHPLMLPWIVEGCIPGVSNGPAYENWDPAISLALAALLPAGFPQRERVSGATLEAELARRPTGEPLIGALTIASMQIEAWHPCIHGPECSSHETFTATTGFLPLEQALAARPVLRLEAALFSPDRNKVMSSLSSHEISPERIDKMLSNLPSMLR